jgi:hypothetical protein
MRSRFLTHLVVAAAIVTNWAATTPAADPVPSGARAPQAAGEKIDFEKAREFLRKRQQGTALTADEQAYLDKARAARDSETKRTEEGQPGAARRPAAPPPRESTGMTPLTEMTAESRYRDQDGGLYGRGANVPPEPHRLAAEKELSHIQPLSAEGQTDANGKIAFVSISMSNATMEFSLFKRLADVDSQKSKSLTIIDCAQGGQAMAEWVSPDARAWQEADRRLAAAGVSPRQVQVAWLKLANKGPTGSLEEHGRKLERDTEAVLHNARSRFPNLRIAYLSSRIYGGYATGNLNPEPYAYESAFPVRWLIQDQIAGRPELNFDAARGAVKSPLLLGPLPVGRRDHAAKVRWIDLHQSRSGRRRDASFRHRAREGGEAVAGVSEDRWPGAELVCGGLALRDRHSLAPAIDFRLDASCQRGRGLG